MSGGGGSAGTADDFCAPKLGLAFCEDFEEHAPGAATTVGPWSPAMNGDGATIEIDGAAAHSGKNSLKVRAGGFNAFYVLNVATAAKAVPSALYVRAYVRITEPMAGGHNTYVVADTLAAPGQGNAFKIGEMNAMLMYNVGGDAHATSGTTTSRSARPPSAASSRYFVTQVPASPDSQLLFSCATVACPPW
ncbi:MAG: hydrolase [Polyangiaceae bacterium]|nr:hydrolase [Polyangiaceae bacterium]